jgi:hypothetical protein
MMNDSKVPVPLPFHELKAAASAVAEAMSTFTQPPAATGGGSRQRGLPEELRKRFIDVRSTLYQRGIYDPLLVRFDTASATQASTQDIAQQLATIAAGL